MLKMQVVTALGTIIPFYYVSKYATMEIQIIKSYKKIFYSTIPLMCDNKYFVLYLNLQIIGPLALPAGFKSNQVLLKICCQAPIKTQPCQAHVIGARTVISFMKSWSTFLNCQSLPSADADTTHKRSQNFYHVKRSSTANHLSENFDVEKNIFPCVKFDDLNNFRSLLEELLVSSGRICARPSGGSLSTTFFSSSRPSPLIAPGSGGT